jgi:hypothetical protein
MDIDRRIGVTERLPVTSDGGSAKFAGPAAENRHRRVGRAEVLVAVLPRNEPRALELVPSPRCAWRY